MNVDVKQSSIHERGVFAFADIDAEYWQYIYGVWCTDENEYCFDRGGHCWEPYQPFCYLNHSNTPNCEVYQYENVMIIEALRDIKRGEELTIDYGFDPGEDNAIHRH